MPKLSMKSTSQVQQEFLLPLARQYVHEIAERCAAGAQRKTAASVNNDHPAQFARMRFEAHRALPETRVFWPPVAQNHTRAVPCFQARFEVVAAPNEHAKLWEVATWP